MSDLDLTQFAGDGTMIAIEAAGVKKLFADAERFVPTGYGFYLTGKAPQI